MTMDLCEPPPPPTGYPNATNTGPTIATTPWTGGNSFSAGATYNGYEFIGRFDVGVPCTFTNCSFYNPIPSTPTGGIYCVVLYVSTINITFENCSFRGGTSSAVLVEVPQPPVQLFRNCHFFEVGNDCIKSSGNLTLIDCFFEKYGWQAVLYGQNTDADAVQSRGGTGYNIHHCYFDVGAGVGPGNGNSAFIFKSDNYAINNVLIEDSFMGGGNSRPFQMAVTSLGISNVTVRNCEMVAGQHGYYGISGITPTWTNVTDYNTGAVIPGP